MRSDALLRDLVKELLWRVFQLEVERCRDCQKLMQQDNWCKIHREQHREILTQQHQLEKAIPSRSRVEAGDERWL